MKIQRVIHKLLDKIEWYMFYCNPPKLLRPFHKYSVIIPMLFLALLVRKEIEAEYGSLRNAAKELNSGMNDHYKEQSIKNSKLSNVLE